MQLTPKDLKIYQKMTVLDSEILNLTQHFVDKFRLHNEFERCNGTIGGEIK